VNNNSASCLRHAASSRRRSALSAGVGTEAGPHRPLRQSRAGVCSCRWDRQATPSTRCDARWRSGRRRQARRSSFSARVLPASADFADLRSLLIRALAESPGRRPHRQGRPHDYGPGDACDGRLALRVCPACAVGACRPCPNFRRPPAAVSASEDGSAMEAALADAQTVVANRRRRVVTSSPVILTCGISAAGAMQRPAEAKPQTSAPTPPAETGSISDFGDTAIVLRPYPGANSSAEESILN
jgi:hypothetical protein